MKHKNSKNSATLQEEFCVLAGKRASPLHNFFLKNYDLITEAYQGKVIIWRDMCELLNKHSITTANGKSPTENTARKAWYAVRKKVQKQREAEAEEAALKEQKAQERREAREREKQDEREGLRRFNLLVERQKEKKAASPPKPTVSISNASQTSEDRYTGPRPAGLPDDVPLDALVPLTATGLTPDGKNYNYEENMPGLPRCSYFDLKIKWVRACWAIMRAKPKSELTKADRRFMIYLTCFPGYDL